MTTSQLHERLHNYMEDLLEWWIDVGMVTDVGMMGVGMVIDGSIGMVSDGNGLRSDASQWSGEVFQYIDVPADKAYQQAHAANISCAFSHH